MRKAAINAEITVRLDETEVAKIRMAFARYLDELGLADMDDPEARAVVVKISAAMEKKVGYRYSQRFE